MALYCDVSTAHERKEKKFYDTLKEKKDSVLKRREKVLRFPHTRCVILPLLVSARVHQHRPLNVAQSQLSDVLVVWVVFVPFWLLSGPMMMMMMVAVVGSDPLCVP